jgi:hypothetical protein
MRILLLIHRGVLIVLAATCWLILPCFQTVGTSVANDAEPVGDKGPWYRNPPEDANHGTTDITGAAGTVTVERWNWLREERDENGNLTFRAWCYAYLTRPMPPRLFFFIR